MSLRIATWNINSVRIRLHLIEALVTQQAPDVICLQEIKCETGHFPHDAFEALGYHHRVVAGQRGYHGVATVAKVPLERIGAEDLHGTGEARHLAVALPIGHRRERLELHNFYVPAGGDVPDPDQNRRFREKLAYLDALEAWSGRLPGRRRRLLVGDLNVAPLEHDVWSHKQMLSVVSHTPVEVERFARVQAAGRWTDVMRQFVPAHEKLYSWWSYRAADWRLSNRGRRLDHVWASANLADAAASLTVVDAARGWERPSDHVPVIVDLDVTPSG
ncbi:MAG: exodeoxyribonuclease III [Hyphomicrobiaceae bacterium]